MSADLPIDSDVSWHDNLIYAMHLRAPDPKNDDWRSELVLDIDHIVEWICAADGKAQFRVAPATLVFHDVTELRVHFDLAGTQAQTLNELSIDEVSKATAPHPGLAPSLPYYKWRIALNWPKSGELTFGASGYTQTLRAGPRLLDEQRLPVRDRPHLLRTDEKSV